MASQEKSVEAGFVASTSIGDIWDYVSRHIWGPPETKPDRPDEPREPGHVYGDRNQKITKWDNGIIKVEYPGERGFLRKPDGSGGYTEQHFGPDPKDNFLMTRWNNGVIKIRGKDGTGVVRVPDEKGGYRDHHWGPNDKDNFDLTMSSDKSVRVAYANGTGHLDTPKGNSGYTEHHWGTQRSDTYDVNSRFELITASESFRKKLDEIYSKIPAQVRKTVDDHGFQWFAVDKLTDLHPADKGHFSASGFDLDSFTGFTVVQKKEFYMAEHPNLTEAQKKAGFPLDVTLVHEVGHVYDDAIGGYSNSEEFTRTFEKDVAALSPSQRSKIAYFVDNHEARKEAFAQLFSESILPGNDFLKPYLPETLKLVQARISS